MKNLILFLISMAASLFGVDTHYCFIADVSKHEENQKLLKSIVNQELACLDPSMTAADRADLLMQNISEIATRLWNDGFAIDAYGIPEIDAHTIASYHSFPLWEGDECMEESLPITFFAYVWPSEESILERHPSHSSRFPYGTKIHSHPIPCAFAVLDGILFQNNYKPNRIAGALPSFREECFKSVHYMGEERFEEFEGALDLLDTSFIHQVYTKGTGSKPVISLHAYGLSSEKKVRKCFFDSRFTHYFDDVVD